MFSAVKEVLSNAADASLHILGFDQPKNSDKNNDDEHPRVAPMSPARIRAKRVDEAVVPDAPTAPAAPAAPAAPTGPTGPTAPTVSVDPVDPMDGPAEPPAVVASPLPRPVPLNVVDMPDLAAPEEPPTPPQKVREVDTQTPARKDSDDDFSFDRWTKK